MVYKSTIDKGFLYQFIPGKYEYLTKTKKIEFNGKKLKTDYIISIINEFMLKYYFRKNDTIDNEIKFNMWSTLLRKKYGHIYNYYINYLIKTEFMYLVSDYCVGVKTKTYRLNRKDIIKVKHVKIYDNILLKKNEKDYLKKSFLNFTKSPIPLVIKQKLVDDLYDVNVDIEKSIQYLTDLKKKKNISQFKHWKNYACLKSLEIQHIFFKFDEYGRMHTNFTTLKKHIRQNYLSIDGEEIEEIDLTNSQPLFLAVLMKNELPTSKLIQSDVTKYFNLVNNGFIYEELINQCGLKNRKEAKTMMYKVLFGVNGDNQNYNKLFYQLFPNVYSFIKNYKKTNNNYKSISHKLQSLESNFIFNTVINHIITSNPDIKIFTIHDSLCFPIKYKKLVTDIFNFHKRKLIS